MGKSQKVSPVQKKSLSTELGALQQLLFSTSSPRLEAIANAGCPVPEAFCDDCLVVTGTWLDDFSTDIPMTDPNGAAIYGNIYHQYTPNVSIYTIHGSYGIYWECHHPNWRSHIFQRGRSTTNQMRFNFKQIAGHSHFSGSQISFVNGVNWIVSICVSPNSMNGDLRPRNSRINNHISSSYIYIYRCSAYLWGYEKDHW